MKPQDFPLSRSNVRRHAARWGVPYDEAWDRLAAASGLDEVDLAGRTITQTTIESLQLSVRSVYPDAFLATAKIPGAPEFQVYSGIHRPSDQWFLLGSGDSRIDAWRRAWGKWRVGRTVIGDDTSS